MSLFLTFLWQFRLKELKTTGIHWAQKKESLMVMSASLEIFVWHEWARWYLALKDITVLNLTWNSQLQSLPAAKVSTARGAQWRAHQVILTTTIQVILREETFVARAITVIGQVRSSQLVHLGSFCLMRWPYRGIAVLVARTENSVLLVAWQMLTRKLRVAMLGTTARIRQLIQSS